ncbi:MAG: FAD-dependent oxidoreductase [Rhodospirillales bacterium]|nr:FAD-dependent oxidoreductase [Rhodospirillales bacterium]
MKRIAVVGGGFAGMWGALAAARKLDQAGVGPDKVEITLINRDGFHCIRPRLYEADLSDVRVPLTTVLTPAGITLLEGDVSAIDPDAREIVVETNTGTRQISYDRMIFAPGSTLRTPDIPGLAEHAFDIDSFDSASRLNAHLDQLPGLPSTAGQFKVVVVGAGFTGLEIVCELPARLAALAAEANTQEQAQVYLVDQAAVPGISLGTNPQAEISRVVQSLGIETRLGVQVTRIENDELLLDDGTSIPTRTVIWTGGALANPIGRSLNVNLDDLGRAPVDGHLRVENTADIFAAGDAARVNTDGTHVAVMSCQHAMPQGKFAGHNAAADLLGEPCLAYRQPTYVTCLGLGPNDAVYTEGWDREVRNTQAHDMKRAIVTQWIYPPLTGDRAEILAAAEPLITDYY